jgi:pilus assembly protein CpaE
MSSASATYDPSMFPAGGYMGAKQGQRAMTAAPYLVTPIRENAPELSIALIGPDETRRSAASLALAGYRGAEVRSLSAYPAAMDDLPRLLDRQHDVVMIDLDSDPACALGLVESISLHGNATVMVYSAQADPDLLMRCMRAGAREFLTVPFAPGAVGEALDRAAMRRPAAATRARKAGKLLVFMGAKGGVGVTSVACNFAVALAQNSRQKTLLIDLDLPLGDAALNLGIVSDFSTIDALKNCERLDGAFLSHLLVKHSSGVWVLAAPGRFPNYEAGQEAIDKLIAVAQQEFDNVVVDLGARVDPQGTALFSEEATIYLVTQAGIPELRNANRLINQMSSHPGPRLEIVLNRFESRTLGVSEEHITKALTRPAQWKVPNDHGVVRKMQINGSPLALGDSAIAQTIRKMAHSVHGEAQAAAPAKKKGFSLFF